MTAVPVHKVVSRIAEIWNLNTFKIRRKLAEVSDIELVKLVLNETPNVTESVSILYPFCPIIIGIVELISDRMMMDFMIGSTSSPSFMTFTLVPSLVHYGCCYGFNEFHYQCYHRFKGHLVFMI